MVVQEARLAGVPLIVSGIGGMAEKVTEGVDGLHFRAGSAPDLARVMRIAAVPANRARIAAGIAPPIGQEAFVRGLREVFGMTEPVPEAAARAA